MRARAKSSVGEAALQTLIERWIEAWERNDVSAFAALLRELAVEGLTVVLVEHDVQLVLRVCDTVSVLDFGQVLASGTPDEIQRNPAVIAAYLGEGVS